MHIIVTHQNTNGTYDEVGTNNRALFSHYKTERGALKAAKRFGRGRLVRVEFFGENIHCAPQKTLYV